MIICTFIPAELRPITPGKDELVPIDGKDEVYDEIMAEINGLEKELDEELKTFEKSVG